jgi:hypothetical protein
MRPSNASSEPKRGIFDHNGWQIVITAMTVGAASFAAGAAFMKPLIGRRRMSQARIDRPEVRLDAFEDRLRRIEDIVIRIDERLAATLPTLATRPNLPTFEPRWSRNSPTSRAGFTCVMAAMVAAYTAALAAGATGAVVLTHSPHH